MKVTVDRFEGEAAVLLVQPDENQQIFFPRELLPDGEIRETEEARARVSSLIDRLRQKVT